MTKISTEQLSAQTIAQRAFARDGRRGALKEASNWVFPWHWAYLIRCIRAEKEFNAEIQQGVQRYGGVDDVISFLQTNDPHFTNLQRLKELLEQ